MKRTYYPPFQQRPGAHGATHPGAYPDDLPDPEPYAPGSAVDAFRCFRITHRRREELCGLPLAAVRALTGAREARFAGYLTIRTDLDAPAYLDVPFVRRAWRLLHFLGEEESDGRTSDRLDEGAHRAHAVAENSPEPARPVSPHAFRQHRIPISWSMTRVLGMDRETARVNIGVLLTILTAAGLLSPVESGGLTPRARTLIRAGSVGEFYKALCLRLFSHVPWVFDDALPPLAAVQLNGLFLTYAIASAGDGLSAWDLAGRLAALSHTVRVEPDSSYWVSDTTTMAAAIHARFLSRVGRMLGLFEEVSDRHGIMDPVRRPYRTTELCRRTFCWQL